MKIFSFGRLRIENGRTSLSAREEYLLAAFEQIDHCHAGLMTYLTKCGVMACEVETLRGLLVD